jgi:hypothetical protein
MLRDAKASRSKTPKFRHLALMGILFGTSGLALFQKPSQAYRLGAKRGTSRQP